MRRIIFALTGAVFITLLFFSLMQHLIATRVSSLTAEKNYKTIERIKLTPKQKEERSIDRNKNKVLSERKPPKIPELAMTQAPPPDISHINIDMPQMKFASSLLDLSSFGDTVISVKVGNAGYGGGSHSKGNGGFRKEIIPQGTIQPAYPKIAANRKLEGWVEVEFTINTDGWVEEVLVVNAEPKGIFEQNTVDAVYKWKFEPIDIPARARQRIEFKLDQLQYYLK